MKTGLIENTDIRVSRLGVGTASLHHLFDVRQRQVLLHTAADVGITHFDTSPYYGYGLAELDLGRFLVGHRATFTLTTKVGLYPWGKSCTNAAGVWVRKAMGRVYQRMAMPVVDWSLERAQESLSQSLQRLQTDYVDFCLLHEPDHMLMATDDLWRWLELEQARGRVRAWGIAGVADRVAAFVRVNHPLARVVQTQDSLDKQQADFMAACGRELQFTYGYLSGQSTSDQHQDAEVVLRSALLRNKTGAVLVSTRRHERLRKIAKVVE